MFGKVKDLVYELMEWLGEQGRMGRLKHLFSCCLAGLMACSFIHAIIGEPIGLPRLFGESALLGSLICFVLTTLNRDR